MNPGVPTRIVIQLSKVKIFLSLLVFIVLVVLTICMWSNPGVQDPLLQLFIRAVAIFFVLIFGLLGIRLYRKLFDTRPGLIIDEEGIVDNSNIWAERRILWDEVVELKVLRNRGGRFISISVTDPQQKFSSFSDRIVKKCFGIRTNTSTIHIYSTLLAVNFGELLQALKSAFEKHRNIVRTSGSS